MVRSGLTHSRQLTCSVKTAQVLVICRRPGLDLRGPRLHLLKQLLGALQVLRPVRKHRQGMLRLTAEAGENAVVTAVGPIVLKLDLKLSVISIFVDVRLVDRQAGVVS